MSHSYAANRVHVVFSTKLRQKLIPEEIQPRLWAFMATVGRDRHIEVPAVGGMDDHAHLVMNVPPVIPLAKAIQSIKAVSSKWMRDLGHARFAWQEGYAAFSVSSSQLDSVIEYVRHQPEHHQKHTFEAEFLSLLTKNGLTYDPKFVFG